MKKNDCEKTLLPLAEELMLIRQAKGGNAEAKMRLVKQYEPLVLAAARQYIRLNFYDDALATGYTALIQAIHQFDEKRGVNFAFWAQAKVSGDMRTLFKREKRKWDREMSGDLETQDGQTILEKIDVPRDEYALLDARLSLKNAVAKLDEREKFIVNEVAVNDRFFADLAPQLNLTPQRIGQIYRKALKKMKKCLLKDERN